MTDIKCTADRILAFLEDYGLQKESPNNYRSNRPWSASSNSLGLVLTIEGAEHGTYFDHVTGKGGSLYKLAEKLGISSNGNHPLAAQKEEYKNLGEYARAHGVDKKVFESAGWKEKDHSGRSALGFPTQNGTRWRFLDGKSPKFINPKGYKACWYGLNRAVEMSKATSKTLVICNGEPSVITGQAWGLPACAVTSGEKSNIPENLFQELKESWKSDILIAPDCDKTGHKMAEGWKSQLEESGYSVEVVDLNGTRGFDLADFCALHLENSYEELVKLKLLQPIATHIPEEERVISDRFSIQWAATVYDKPPKIDFLVDGLIASGSVNLIVGEGGAKKTWSMIDLGVAVASGKKWLEFNTKSGVVLFIDEESGPKRFRQRLHNALHGQMAIPATPFGFISLAQLDLQSKTDTDELKRLIRIHSASLVIIDALADVMGGADENAVKDVQPIFMKLRKIAEETGAAIILIHHTNKNKIYRGSTAIKGAIDLMLLIESKPKDTHIKFTVEKARDIEPFEFSATANFIAESGEFFLSPAENEVEPHQLGKAQEHVLRYLTIHGPSLVTKIKSQTQGCSINSVHQAIHNSLRSGGFIERIDGGGPGEKATYDLTEKGRKLVKESRLIP